MVGWATLPSYGLTWDEGLGDFHFGDRYWEFFKSGFDERYLDNELDAIDYYREPGQVDFFQSPFRNNPAHFWPVANIVCSMFGELLNRRLGVFDPVDARHAGIVFLGALTLLAVWVFTRNAFGTTAAVLAGVFLGTHPQFFGHAHNNIKDVGVSAFYAWTLVAFWHAMSRNPVERAPDRLSMRESSGHSAIVADAQSRDRLQSLDSPKSPKNIGWLIFSGVLFGLALGTKLNALFILPTLLIWLALRAVVRFTRERRSTTSSTPWWRRFQIRPFLAVALVALIGVPVYVFSWPWLWADPIGRERSHIKAFVDVAERGPDHWQIYPWREALIGTPPALLFAFALGCLGVVASSENRRRASTVLLVVIWLIVPFVRGTLPGHFNYDGMRRYMEFLPAAAILAGLGVAWLLTLLPNELGRARRLACVAIALLFVAPPLWEDVRIHPNQTSYLNALRGDSLPQDYWGNSYRAGCRWLNEHAEPSARVLVPIPRHTKQLAAPIWLRPDLSVSNAKEAVPYVPNPATYVMLLERLDLAEHKAPNLDQSGALVHQIRVDDHPILEIYRLEKDWSPVSKPRRPSRPERGEE